MHVLYFLHSFYSKHCPCLQWNKEHESTKVCGIHKVAISSPFLRQTSGIIYVSGFHLLYATTHHRNPLYNPTILIQNSNKANAMQLCAQISTSDPSKNGSRLSLLRRLKTTDPYKPHQRIDGPAQRRFAYDWRSGNEKPNVTSQLVCSFIVGFQLGYNVTPARFLPPRWSAQFWRTKFCQLGSSVSLSSRVRRSCREAKTFRFSSGCPPAFLVFRPPSGLLWRMEGARFFVCKRCTWFACSNPNWKCSMFYFTLTCSYLITCSYWEVQMWFASTWVATNVCGNLGCAMPVQA